MCKHCDEDNRQQTETLMPGRRNLLMAGAGLMAAPLLGGIPDAALAAPAQPATAGNGPYPTRAYAANAVGGPLQAMQIERRALGPKDVLLDILYCGICHSDIHNVNNDWGGSEYPVVPGHEIIGRVAAIGSAVTRFRVGDIGGVGCMVNACGQCENCEADREQNCLNGTTFTYDSEDTISGGRTFGGYSDKVVVTEHFVIRIPPGADLAAIAPLLCAGVTTFSPMQHWQLGAGQRVGVIGLGGLGHMAVKLAVARKAEVTVFTTTPGKVSDARRLGAKEAVVWNDLEKLAPYTNRFDLLIATVPQAFPLQPFMNILKLDGSLVNVGALGQLEGVNGMALGFGRKSLAGSMIGGIAETQEVIDYCAARNIKADIELIRPDEINRAYQRVIDKDVRYRFVIDMTTA